MNHRKKVWVFGVALLGVAACAPTIRELGNEPVGGAGSGGTDTGGTGSGGTDTGGTGTGGTGAALPSGGTRPSPQPTAGEPSGGGAAPDDDCFSPTQRPGLALAPNGVGCACDAEPPECVLTEYNGTPWRVSLYCEDGQWVPAEDGVCGNGRQADCRVDGVTYPHGARRVPSPFTQCNTCGCDDGQLVDCTRYKCQSSCPAGSFEAKRCAECGPADGCAVFEHGCFTDPSCEGGFCLPECP
jgi:hypothetical protein